MIWSPLQCRCMLATKWHSSLHFKKISAAWALMTSHISSKSSTVFLHCPQIAIPTNKAVKPMWSEELVSFRPLMFVIFSHRWWPGMKGHLCHLPRAWTFLAIFTLHKHMTLSTIQPGPRGNISNECFSGPSGLGVLAGLNASGLRVCPRAKHGSFGPSNAVRG